MHCAEAAQGSGQPQRTLAALAQVELLLRCGKLTANSLFVSLPSGLPPRLRPARHTSSGGAFCAGPGSIRRVLSYRRRSSCAVRCRAPSDSPSAGLSFGLLAGQHTSPGTSTQIRRSSGTIPTRVTSPRLVSGQTGLFCSSVSATE